MIFKDQKERKLHDKLTQKQQKIYLKKSKKKKKNIPEVYKQTNYNFQSLIKVGNLKQATENKAAKQQPTNGGVREREWRGKEAAIDLGHLYCFSCETDKENGG